MKNFKYILVIILSMGMLNSCLIEDDTSLDLNSEGPNLAGFTNTQAAITEVADGTEYTYYVKMRLVGPTSMDETSDIEVTVAADDASTAIEGTHYRIDDYSVTLTKANNYLAELEVTMLTAGIETPLEESPKLILNVVEASGASNLVPNGKPIKITLNYACPSELQGTYDVVTTSSSGTTRAWTETITKIGVGKYLTQRVGTWDPPLNPNYGFEFTDVCSVITVPLQGLADMYSNDVYGHQAGFVDEETGVITIYYTIDFSSGAVEYTAVYTPI